MANYGAKVPVTAGLVGDVDRTASNLSTLTAASTTAEAAAVAKGAGDAHVETLAAQAAFVATLAAITTAGVFVSVNTTDVTTLTQLRAALDKIFKDARYSGVFTA
jgi:hypothetical protein